MSNSIRRQLSICAVDRRFYLENLQRAAKFGLEKLFPLFNEDELNKDLINYCDNLYEQEIDQIDYRNHDPPDPDEIYSKITNAECEHFVFLSLGKYQIIAAWHVVFYQLFEQQLIKFLSDYRLSGPKDNLKKIKKVFEEHGINIGSFQCWPKIEELSLLSNVIKHGDGRSAKQLRERNPAIFKGYSNSTLLAETLNISEESFDSYSQEILLFWKEIPCCDDWENLNKMTTMEFYEWIK